MNRIQKLFSEKTEKVIPFIPAGFPNLDSTQELVLAAVDTGADMVEIGMPFSDPLADGPVIQEANQVALKNGINLNLILKQVKEIRKKTQIPLVLMGYINPILKYGQNQFIEDCKSSGVDGLIIPDLPPEEADELISICRKSGISLILLVAPNTSDKRIEYISKLAGDLIYCVSIMGITGSGLSGQSALSEYLKRVKKYSKTPFIVGFGIKTRKDVQFINTLADGAVVGSSFIRKIQKTEKTLETVKNYIIELKGT